MQFVSVPFVTRSLFQSALAGDTDPSTSAKVATETAMIDFLDFTYIPPVPNWFRRVYVCFLPLTMLFGVKNSVNLCQRNADLLSGRDGAIR